MSLEKLVLKKNLDVNCKNGIEIVVTSNQSDAKKILMVWRKKKKENEMHDFSGGTVKLQTDVF